MERDRRITRVAASCAVFAALLAGCASVTFIAAYDEVYDQQLVSTQKDIDGFLQKLSDEGADPAATYAANVDNYGKLIVDLNSLLVRAKTHDKNGESIDQIGRVLNTVNDLKALHMRADHLGAKFIADERAILDQDFQAMERLEQDKKLTNLKAK